MQNKAALFKDVEEAEQDQVCTLGFLILGVSLFVVVQSKHVYPDLLLARILFSVGGAACSTVRSTKDPSVSD